MDGVLVDSTPAVARVWTWWAHQHGFDPDSVVRQAHGRPSIATIRELLPGAGDETLWAEDLEVERREMEDFEDVVALPGAKEILTALPSDRWAMVTSATRALAEVRMRASGLPIPKHLVTARDAARGKPFPDPYLKGAESLRIAPADCIVVEDAPSGIRAGRAAGSRVIAVRTTADDAELRAAGAHWIINDLAALCPDGPAGAGELSLLLRETR
jgi:mannitol-1-/sugar-/sorbitol-6-phosphatase